MIAPQKNNGEYRSDTDDDYEQVDENQTSFARNKRTSDIYERFINRVQQIDGEGAEGEGSNNSDVEDSFSILSSYDPLSEEELKFFSNDTEDQSSRVIDSDTEENKVEAVTDVPLYIADHTPNLTTRAPDLAINKAREDDKSEMSFGDNESINPLSKPLLTPKKKERIPANPVNNIKLLTTGLICGLLLSAAVIFILNKAGLLSTLMPSVKTEQQDIPIHASPQAPVTSETAVMPADQASTQEASKPEAPSVKPAIRDPAITQPSIELNQQPTRDSAISLEDFQREAQSTLYRETND